LPKLQRMAADFQLIYLQEILLSSISQFNISGFRSVRLDAVAPGTHGLCILIYDDYNFSIIDCGVLSHPFTKVLGL